MKTRLMILGIVVACFSCGSCNQSAKTEESKNNDAAIASEENAVKTPKINADSLVKVIDIERERLENNLKSFQKKTLSTKDLRPQVKQKWSKIDFYTENDQIVRIKSYPYDKISQRTEEFYFQKGKLILAFIEDDGSKFIGKEPKRAGKTYYFFEDSFLKEANVTNEKETTIRSSDGERLLQEATEYLELYPKN